jgi:hypothetical protein
MMNWKSISLALVLGLSNSFLLLSDPLKADAQVICASENSKIDFETSNYWVSIQCKEGKLYYYSSEKESHKSVKVSAIYDNQTDTYIAQSSLKTYAINFLSLNIYQRGHEVVKEPVLNIYTNSKTSDLDFFNPNRKVAYSPLNINPYENDLIYTYQIKS